MQLSLPRARFTGLALITATAIFVASCAGEAASQATPGVPSTAIATGEAVPQASPGAPSTAIATGGVASHSIESIKSNLPADFEVQAYRRSDALGGERVELSQVLAHGKPVALNFFAGLCPPCRAEMPDLQEVHNRLGNRFVMLSVDVGPYTGLGTNDDGLRLVEELDLTFPTGSTRDAQVVNRYRILGMPSTVFITPDGKVLRKWDGALNQAKMEELVKQLISASGS